MLELNRFKTEELCLGSDKNRTDLPFGIRWPKDYVNALGICFTTDQNISYSKNFESRLTRLLSLEKCVNVWSSKDLTLYGKIINPVKSLTLSKLTFVAAVLPTPEDFTKSVNKQIVDFIWSHKTDPKIKQATMIDEKRRGLGMPDFDIIKKSF